MRKQPHLPPAQPRPQPQPWRPRPQLRVLYISGYAKDTVLDNRQLDARAAFLEKPFTAETLTGRVRELLDR